MSLTNWRKLHGDFFAGRSALITGGAGFIGSHLAEALSELGAKVMVLDDLSGGDTENLRPLADVEFVEGTILHTGLVERVMSGRDFVFHQAALGSVPRSIEQPRLYHEVNVTGTLNVLEAAREAKVKRVMFAASSSAYGDSEELPKRETMPVQPKSPYAANKIACEALMRAYSGSYGLDTCSLRYFNIFGPRQNANSAYAAVIAAFAKAVVEGKAPVIFGDGEQSRDFTYVDNAVQANLLAARVDRPMGGEVINVACGVRVSVNELARQICEAMGRKDLKARHEPERAGDVKHSLADLSKAQQLLGYKPVTEFTMGLKPTLEWYRQILK